MWRVGLGIIAGITIAMVCIFVTEIAGHLLYPPPTDAAMNTPDAVADYIASAPTMALVFPPLGWFLGAAIGGGAARYIGRKPWAGWVIAGVVLAGGIVNLFLIPAPIWMQIAAVAAPLWGGWVAAKIPTGALPMD